MSFIYIFEKYFLTENKYMCFIYIKLVKYYQSTESKKYLTWWSGEIIYSSNIIYIGNLNLKKKINPCLTHRKRVG